MSLLLPLPAIGMVVLQALGGREAITQGMIVFQVSVMYGYPFRKRAPSYFARAFDLSRQFLYKWTVNWRFIPETTFLSTPFAITLLTIHASLLLLFATTRWNAPSRRPLKTLLKLIWAPEPRDQDQVARRVDPKFIMTSMLTAMVIGLLCARSLHYQFYAYLAWTTPFLLWRAGFHPILQYALWGLQEWAWNVYPSTPVSSAAVVAVLAVQVAGVWWGTRYEGEVVDANGGPGGRHEHLE
jgi:alpha-1,3-mannosyltransferase